MAAASGLAQEYRIMLSPKFKIRNSTSSVYSRLYGIFKRLYYVSLGSLDRFDNFDGLGKLDSF